MALAQYAAAEDSWDDDLEMPEDGVLALPAFRPEPVLQVNTEPDAIESVPQPEPAEAAPTNKVVYVDEPVVNEIASEAAVVAEPAVLEATTNASVERVESQPFADQATDASPGQAEVEAIAVTAEPEVAPLAAQASAAELVVAPVIDAVQVEVEGALGEVEPVMQTAASSMSFMDDGGVVPYKLEMTQSAQELVPLADLRSIGSSTSNFNDDLDFSDSASQLGKGPVQYQMPDKDGSSASLDAFLDCGASDVSRPSVPQALRRMMHSPAPSHGTAASNMDFEGDDFLADFEVPESFEVDGSFLERRLHLTRGQSSSFALLDHPPSGGDDTDMFDDLEVPEDAFARAYQAPARQRSWNAEEIPPPLSGPPGHSFNEPAPENLQIRIGPGISVTTVPVHEVSELDDIDDLEVSIEKESKFETAPRLPNLLKRNRAETANSGTAGGNTSPRRIEIRSSLTAPTASFLAKMREPVRQSQHKNQNKKAKRPELIQNLGSANTVKVIGEMRWNPHLQKWEGNEDVLRDFDPPPPPLRPALITNFGASARNPQTVGNMVWDPTTMSWRGNEDDGLVFDGFDDEDDNQSMISVATGLTGVAGMRTFEVSFNTRQGFMAAERDHMISTSRWYPQRQGHIPSLGSQRLPTRSHLSEIRNIVPND